MLEKFLKTSLIICVIGLVCGRIMIAYGVNHQDTIILGRGIMLNLCLLMPTLWTGFLLLSISPLPAYQADSN